MKKNKDRKADIEIIKEVFNWNEYHPNKVKANFNKAHWFYEVEVTPANPKKDNELDWVRQKSMIKLHENDLIILSVMFTRKWKPGIWSSNPDGRISDTVESCNLRIGRRDEFYQYRGYEY